MASYIIRRLLLLPITLFLIVMINFLIINMAPGDPTTITETKAEGAIRQENDAATAFGSDDRYLQFREHYGLTLPVLVNLWPSISKEETYKTLKQLVTRKQYPTDREEMEVKEYDRLKVRFGDQSRYVMPHLLAIMNDKGTDFKIRQMAMRFFVRGGTHQAHLGANLSKKQKNWNRHVAQDNTLLRTLWIASSDDAEQVNAKLAKATKWYKANRLRYRYEPVFSQKVQIAVMETRFSRYLSRVLTLDFGTLRNDSNKTVVKEVGKRFKYSLTLAVLPMLITFVLCQVFGFFMALKQNGWQDVALNVVFLILYAAPVFVVAPFLIEKVAMGGTWPFTDTPIPLSGFTSSEEVYSQLTSWERLWDILQHITLPLVAIMYGGLAAQSRLSRTAVLEVMRQDYVRTAKAKGLSSLKILSTHVGRNAGITIVTSVAASLGVVLGGSLIVETLFEINGFGKFFYEAVLNRDYNVIMFSAIAGSFLALIGYLLADIAYTILDPRVTLS
jgi:peptide/nickel transport system permease protein